MRFDEHFNLPRVEGADDFADSSHLCGILWFIDHPQKPDPTQYVIKSGRAPAFKYVRHPDEFRYDMSRDNALLLMYALYKAGRVDLIDLNFIDGKDLYSPAVHGMVRIMKGKKPWPWQTWWFRKELETNWDLQRLEEPFQIMVMCDVYGKQWLSDWKQNNSLWHWAIKRYLSELDGAWRKEPQLAMDSVNTVLDKIK